jgi:hypothetical protein
MEIIITPKFIKELVEKETNVGDISTLSRKREFNDARLLYFELCRKYLTKVTLTEIAECVGRTNHATTLNAYKQFKDLYNFDFLYKKEYEFCNTIVRGMFLDSVTKDSEDKINRLNTIISHYEKAKSELINNINVTFQKIN